MPYCIKCGSEVGEEMAFCPKCGAALKVEKPPVGEYRAEKAEKAEKREKEEKRQKTEKHEKREFGVIASLIGGLILIFAGIMSYLAEFFTWRDVWPYFLILVGIIIIVGAVYGISLARRRHPKT